MILQKWENNGTEEIGLVTPTPRRDKNIPTKVLTNICTTRKLVNTAGLTDRCFHKMDPYQMTTCNMLKVYYIC